MEDEGSHCVQSKHVLYDIDEGTDDEEGFVDGLPHQSTVPSATNDTPAVETQVFSKKQPSEAWVYFEQVLVDGVPKAECRKCKKRLCRGGNSGTSHLVKHDFPPNLLRQWRPNAQRNLKNQWCKLSALRNQWFSSSSSARSHATSLVNSYLSSRYLDDMNLGVLSDMPNIRNKARCKFLKQQELQLNQLLVSYKSMVGVVVDMINSSRSLRCFLNATSGSPLIEFTSSAANSNSNDTGDGGGATVFTFLPISAFEMLAEELSEMFKQELLLKRLLVVELLSVTFQKHELFTQLSWVEDLYHGEADDLSTCNMYSKETAKPCLPKLNGCRSDSAYLESDKHPSNDILQVYLTTWLAEVNIDTYRVEEIFATVGEEMRNTHLF